MTQSAFERCACGAPIVAGPSRFHCTDSRCPLQGRAQAFSEESLTWEPTPYAPSWLVPVGTFLCYALPIALFWGTVILLLTLS